ncbi:MAG: transglycosylase SLT domain-containing protein [Candidatus Obscuribacterales bacterium]|nr:transglycosylase SLT domain-containing protein [Candidatus Obscuribacterales bacterium]
MSQSSSIQKGLPQTSSIQNGLSKEHFSPKQLKRAGDSAKKTLALSLLLSFMTLLGPNQKSNDGKNSYGSPAFAQRTQQAQFSQQPQPAFKISPEYSQVWKQPSRAFQEAMTASSLDRLKTLASQNFPGFTATERRFAEYSLACQLQKSQSKENSRKALEIFTELSSDSQLKTLCLWRCASLTASLGDEAQLRNVLSSIVKAHEAESQDIARASYELAQSYIRAQEIERALPLLNSLRQRFANSEYAKGALYYLGQIDLNRAIQITYPSTNAATGAASSATSDRQPNPESAAGSVNGAGGNGSNTNANSGNASAVSSQISVTDQEALASALAAFREYIKSTPTGRFAGEIADKLLNLNQNCAAVTLSSLDFDSIGMVYYRKGDFGKAVKYLDKAGTNERLFQKAQCLAKIGQGEAALVMLFRAIEKDPASTSYDEITDTITGPMSRQKTLEVWKKIVTLKPKHLDHALWNVAVRSEDEDAIKILEKLLAEYPTSEHAPESLWWIFWHQTKSIFPDKLAANKVKALSLAKLAESGLMRYPKHRSAARFSFWAGRIHEKLGQAQQARLAYETAAQKYPTNYYGGRARHRLEALAKQIPGKPLQDRAWSTSSTRRGPETWNWPGPGSLFDYDRVANQIGALPVLLSLVGQTEEALEMTSDRLNKLGESAANKDQITGFKTHLYLKLKQEIEAIRTAGRDLGEIPSKSPRWQMLYPWAYAKQIADASKAYGVDPYLVHALIREESRYYARALSRSKAIGLMQLLPSTARGVAKTLGITVASDEDVFIPDNNIKLGTKYLSSVLSRKNNHAMLAVASYNGGPNAVTKWLNQHLAAGGTDLDVFVENIPYRETRDYVRKVFGSYWTYELMYPPKFAAAGESGTVDPGDSSKNEAADYSN